MKPNYLPDPTTWLTESTLPSHTELLLEEPALLAAYLEAQETPNEFDAYCGAYWEHQ